MIKIFFLLFIFIFKGNLNPELIIGKERVKPGIIFIFEGAIKDHITPISMHLSESLTNVHIEARVNWGSDNIPNGAPSEGFVPYLNITATITNQNSGLLTFIDLKPHVNLVDNFHYARNISLPGKINELYTVKYLGNVSVAKIKTSRISNKTFNLSKVTGSQGPVSVGEIFLPYPSLP